MYLRFDLVSIFSVECYKRMYQFKILSQMDTIDCLSQVIPHQTQDQNKSFYLTLQYFAIILYASRHTKRSAIKILEYKSQLQSQIFAICNLLWKAHLLIHHFFRGRSPRNIVTIEQFSAVLTRFVHRKATVLVTATVVEIF